MFRIKMEIFFVSLLLIIGFLIIPKESFASSEDISLTELRPYAKSGYFSVNKWEKYGQFTNVFGSIIPTGIGLYTSGSYGGTAAAYYNIEAMGYKTFRSTVTLDSQWINGDFGKTAIGFYADDTLLYEKQLSKNDGVLNVNLKLPSKVKEFHIIVKQLNGARGTQGLVLGDPYFSTSGTYLPQTDTSVALATIGAIDSSNYYFRGQWDDHKVFQNIKESIVTRGIGLYTSGSTGGTAFATYNIDEMGFNQFTTKLSLDSKWSVGDFGRTIVGIYADDYLLYEKEMTPNTPVQSIKLNLPKGTKNVKLIAKQLNGARGTHNVVFINPLMKKTNAKVKTVPKTSMLSTVGAIDASSKYYVNSWDKQPFQFYNGKMTTSGIGLTTSGSYGGTGYAVYDITNMGFNSIKTKVSLDSKWLIGDYGSTHISIYADKKVIYSASLKKNGVKNLTLRFPNSTKSIKLEITQKKGAKGTHNVVFSNAVFTNLPISSKLSGSQVAISNIKQKDDTITFKSLRKNDSIKIYNSSNQLLASGVSSGTSLSLKIKQLGTKSGTVYITRTSSGKLVSDKLAVGFKAEPVSAVSR